MWITESSLPNGGIGVPQISYCSPLTRAMVTNTIIFSKQLEAGTIHTVVVEVFCPFYILGTWLTVPTHHVQDCREFIYTSESEKRRTASYISLAFPKFSLEPGFAQGTDPYWNENNGESENAADLRAQKVVDKIFKSEPQGKICKYRDFSTRKFGTLISHP